MSDIALDKFIRKHLDLEEKADLKKQSNDAISFYNNLAERAVKLRTCIDIFAYSLVEFGLYEMA